MSRLALNLAAFSNAPPFLSGSATFNFTSAYKDSIARHYRLDANGSWVRVLDNTYHGEIDVSFDRHYARENAPYTRTPCNTEISGSGGGQ